MPLRRFIKQLISSPLGSNTVAVIIGLGGRTLAQGLMFLIVARVLGVQGYGAYSAVLAIASSLGCFVGLGAPFLLIREVARNRKRFDTAWSKALFAILLSTPFLLALHLLVSRVIVPSKVSWLSIIAIGLAEILFAPLAQTAANAYQGHDRFAHSSKLILAPAIVRLLASIFLLGTLWSFPAPALLNIWSVLYGIASAVAATYALYMIYNDFGPTVGSDGKRVENLWEGIAFAFGGAAIRLYSDVDKAMLAKMATLEATGAYSAACRVVDMALVPISSLLTASLPSFFRAKEAGSTYTLKLASRLIRLPALYATAIGIVVFLFAGALPLLLGATYVESKLVLQWLAWMPLFSLPRLFLQQLLIGNDHQVAAVITLAAGALINVALNLILIPPLSWLGAVFATYLSELTMCFAMAYLVWRKVHQPMTSL